MPYSANRDLPASVRNHLPEHAQDIYRAAFNHAYATYSGQAECERLAHMIAWAAVKRTYYKRGDKWIERIAAAS
jgi:cation transport regulator